MLSLCVCVAGPGRLRLSEDVLRAGPPAHTRLQTAQGEPGQAGPSGEEAERRPGAIGEPAEGEEEEEATPQTGLSARGRVDAGTGWRSGSDGSAARERHPSEWESFSLHGPQEQTDEVAVAQADSAQGGAVLRVPCSM